MDGMGVITAARMAVLTPDYPSEDHARRYHLGPTALFDASTAAKAHRLPCSAHNDRISRNF
jgi:hypothetical protein